MLWFYLLFKDIALFEAVKLNSQHYQGFYDVYIRFELLKNANKFNKM